MTWIYKKN